MFEQLMPLILAGETEDFKREFLALKANQNNFNPNISNKNQTIFLAALYAGQLEICNFLRNQGVSIFGTCSSATTIIYRIEDKDILEYCLRIYDLHLRPLEKSIIAYKINLHSEKRQKPSWNEYILQERQALFAIYGLATQLEESIRDITKDELFNLMMTLAKYNRVEIFKLLLGKAPRVFLRKKNHPGEQTLLATAIWENQDDIVAALLEAGANANQHAGTGNEPPILLAATRGNLIIVQQLIGAGAVVDKKSKAGDTAIHYAVSNGHLAIVCALANAGADLNARGAQGDTPMSIAITQSPGIASLLADYGTDLHKPTCLYGDEKLTPTWYAFTQGKSEIRNALKERHRFFALDFRTIGQQGKHAPNATEANALKEFDAKKNVPR